VSKSRPPSSVSSRVNSIWSRLSGSRASAISCLSSSPEMNPDRSASSLRVTEPEQARQGHHDPDLVLLRPSDQLGCCIGLAVLDRFAKGFAVGIDGLQVGAEQFAGVSIDVFDFQPVGLFGGFIVFVVVLRLVESEPAKQQAGEQVGAALLFGSGGRAVRSITRIWSASRSPRWKASQTAGRPLASRRYRQAGSARDRAGRAASPQAHRLRIHLIWPAGFGANRRLRQRRSSLRTAHRVSHRSPGYRASAAAAPGVHLPPPRGPQPHRLDCPPL
jgi:hypothetical protein